MMQIILYTYFILLPVRDFFLYRLRGMDIGMCDTFNRIVFWAIPHALDAAVILVSVV